MDSRGDRFLKRFAGGDDFQKRLNHGRRGPQDRGRSAYTRPMPSFDNNYSEQNRPKVGYRDDYSAPSYGPNFEKQVKREQSLQAEQGQNDSRASSDIFNKYSFGNRNVQRGRSDGSNIANKYINNARETNPIDIVALDKHIRRGPMYHEAKSELAGLLTYGDKYRNSRENIKGWAQPSPTPDVESPDFNNMYDRFKDDVDDIDI